MIKITAWLNLIKKRGSKQFSWNSSDELNTKFISFLANSMYVIFFKKNIDVCNTNLLSFKVSDIWWNQPKAITSYSLPFLLPYFLSTPYPFLPLSIHFTKCPMNVIILYWHKSYLHSSVFPRNKCIILVHRPFPLSRLYAVIQISLSFINHRYLGQLFACRLLCGLQKIMDATRKSDRKLTQEVYTKYSGKASTANFQFNAWTHPPPWLRMRTQST